MALSKKYDEALAWASDLHRDQVRKGTGEQGEETPYLTHLTSVSALVLEYGGDEEQAIAGLLHDAIEDTPTTEADIAERFGERTGRIVMGCTDATVIPKPPWEQRKRDYIDSVSSKDPEILLVSLADKTHNARCIAADVAREGEPYFENFTGKADGTRWYYRRLADVFTARRDELAKPGMYADGTHLLDEYLRVIESFDATPDAADAYDSRAGR